MKSWFEKGWATISWNVAMRSLKQAMGREALDLFHREAPDLVLLDIQLPILNGLEVLKTIRKTSSVPVPSCWRPSMTRDYKLTAFGVGRWLPGKPFSLVPLEGPYRSYFKSFKPSLGLHLWRGTGGFWELHSQLSWASHFHECQGVGNLGILAPAWG